MALRLAEGIPVERLHPAVRAWVAGRTRSARGAWAVACSGGADSVALLLLMWAHWPERRKKLLVVHFDHRVRGVASARDERFCRSLAGELGCRYRAGRWKGARKEAGEAELRTVRHAFFKTELERAGGLALWLGHQADDVAETMFMRMARGSGAGGLAVPRPVQRLEGGWVRVRPLLGIGKAELRERLEEAGGLWREDESNLEGRYFRNRIRTEVVPAWRRATSDRNALAGACLSRELLQEDDEALEAWLDELRPLGRGARLDLGVLGGRPRALWRRAIHRWLKASGYRGDLSKRGFEHLLDAAVLGKPTRQSMGSEGFAVIDGRLLRYSKNLGRRTQK